MTWAHHFIFSPQVYDWAFNVGPPQTQYPPLSDRLHRGRVFVIGRRRPDEHVVREGPGFDAAFKHYLEKSIDDDPADFNLGAVKHSTGNIRSSEPARPG